MSSAFRFLLAATAACAGLFVALAFLNGLGLFEAKGEDYIQDYFSARGLWNGTDPYPALNATRIANGIPPRADNYIVPTNPHLPVSVLIVLPFASFRIQEALWLHELAQTALAGLALAVLRPLWKPLPLFALGLLVGAWPPVWQGIDWGHPMGVYLLAISLFWRFRTRRAVTFPIYVLLAFCKPVFWYLGAYLFWQQPGGWRERFLLAACCAAGVLLFPLVGDSPLGWYARARGVSHFLDLAFSVASLLHLTIPVGQALFFAAFFLLFAWGAKAAMQPRYLALLVIGNLAFYPLTWWFYYALLLPIFLDGEAATTRRRERFLLALAWLLIANPVRCEADWLVQLTYRSYLVGLALLAWVVWRTPAPVEDSAASLSLGATT